MSCKGLHCSGCGHRSRFGLIALVLVVVIVIAVRKPAEHVIVTTEHIMSVVAEVLLISCIVAAGLGSISLATIAVIKVRRWHVARSVEPAQIKLEPVWALDNRHLELEPLRLVQPLTELDLGPATTPPSER